MGNSGKKRELRLQESDEFTGPREPDQLISPVNMLSGVANEHRHVILDLLNNSPDGRMDYDEPGKVQLVGGELEQDLLTLGELCDPTIEKFVIQND